MFCSILKKKQMSIVSVSYTHLDVYKRQVQLLSSNQFRTDYGVVYVGLFVTIIPLVVVYLVLSKYIVAGVALGGVKG